MAGALLILLRLASLLPKEIRQALPLWTRILPQRKTSRAQRAHSRKLAQSIERLGPVAIKIGQFIATRPDMVGENLASGLEKLQDQAPPFPTAEARLSVEKEMNAPLHALFREFSEPCAAASIAQVHRAKDMEGQALAVKLLRPDIEKIFARDLADLQRIARHLEKHDPSRRLRLKEAFKRIARNVRREMDLRLEAAAIEEMRENQKNRAKERAFILPKVAWGLTSKRMLATSWIEGAPLGDMEALDAIGADRPRLARSLVRIFLTQALHDGFFHADMHRGNLFAAEESRIAAVDFGIMGHLAEEERFLLAEIFHGFLTRDFARAARAHFAAAYVPRDQDEGAFAQALRAIVSPILDKRAHQVSMGGLLAQLFEMTALFEMEAQPQLLLLQKTMLAVEGLARRIDPELDNWSAAAPVIEDFLRLQADPAIRVRAIWRESARLARILPALIDRLEEWARREKDGDDGHDEGELPNAPPKD